MNVGLSLMYNVPQTITIDNIISEIAKYDMTKENYDLKSAIAIPKNIIINNNINKDNNKSDSKSKSKSAPVKIIESQPAPEPAPYSDYTEICVPNSLFWCLYIGKIGLSDFAVLPQNKYKNVEMEQKQNAIKFLTASSTKWNKQINHKITNVKFTELMTDLLLNNEVDVYIAFLLSLYYDLHIYLVNFDETVYMEYIPDTAKYVSGGVYNNTIIVKRQNSGRYSIDTSATIDKIGKITQLYKIDNLCKPVNGISTYKTAELIDFLKKLGVDANGKKKADIFIEYKKYIETKTFFTLS